MNYDFVIEFENLAKESNYLLKYIQRNDPESMKVFFNESTNHLIDENETLNAFLELDEAVIEKLLQIYDEDFKILNYSFI